MYNRSGYKLLNNNAYTSGQIRTSRDALIENVITKYGIPEHIILDQDSAFMSSLMNYLLNKFNIKIKTVAPHSHQSFQAEHGIEIFIKHFNQALN